MIKYITMPYLTKDQKKLWKEDGYLVLPSFFTDEETKDMLDEAKRLCDEFDIEGHPMVGAVESYLLSPRLITFYRQRLKPRQMMHMSETSTF